MKKILFLLVMLMATMPLVVNAQLTATFGTGTSATTTGGSAGAPMSYGGAYSWCQQIYRASEFTAANVPAGAVIIAIEFYNATGATVMSDLRTYMGHRTSEYFSGTSDWAPFNTLQLVDSGDWVSPAGWFSIELDNPFVWDGVSNVVLGVSFRGAHSDYSTNNPNCGYQYTSQGTGNNAHIRRYSTTLSSCDPTSTATANSVSPNRPNLRITYVVSGCASLAPSVANIGPNSADLYWMNFQQSVASWDLMYGEAGTFDTLGGGLMVTNLTDTFYTLTGLSSGTTYAVYMKPYCSSEEGSWSSPRIFTTLAACATPTNLTVMSHTAEEATVSWQAGDAETGWEVVCVPHGSPAYTGTPEYAYSSPYTIMNLTDDTQYDVYVRADCGTGEYSYWSSAVTFTTDPYCTPPTHVTADQVQATSALITWGSALVGATAYTVGYSEAGMENWITQSVTGTSCMISGLEPNTEYDVFVLSECDMGDADTVYTTLTTPCLSGGDPFTEGTTTTYLLPLNNYYNYSYTQQIFLASEMGGAATIDSIAFQYAYATASTDKTNVVIYLGHTTQSTFSSTTNYIPIAGMQQVYSGHLNCSQGWNTFVFTTPFQYNGTDNLVLVIDDNSGDYNGSSYTFYAHNAGANRSVYYYSDSSNPDPTNPTSNSPSSSTSSNRSNVKFFIPCDNTVSCVAPNIYVSEFDDESITVNWAPGYMESSWELEYSTDNTNWVSEGTVTTAPYTISGLDANTVYYIRIRSICGGDNSDWRMVSERTACEDMATLPFMENFDSWTGATTSTSVATNNLPYCWNYINEGTSTSYSGYPIIYNSSSYAASGTNSMRFYTYITAGTYDDQIAILPSIDVDVFPINTLQLVLDARANSTSYNFKLDVGVMTDPTDRNTFVTIQTINTQSTTYANYEIPLNQYQGTGKYIALRASQPTTGYNYGYVDNIRVELIPACPKPTNVASSNITTNSVTLSWNEVGSASSWIVTYGPAGFTPGSAISTSETVYDNPCTITGLSASTNYDFYIQSDCGGGESSSMSNVHTAATLCDVVTALPLMENFDSYPGSTTTTMATNNLPVCWTNHNTGTSTSYSGYPIIYNSSTYSASGSNAMRFYTYITSGTYSDQIAILPQIDVNTLPINTLQLSFDARQNSSSYTFTLVVGVMSDPTNATTFVPVQTVSVTSTTYNNFMVPLTQYTGTGSYIAIKASQPTSGYNYGYVDNVVLDLAPLCDRPTSVTASNVTASTADINWIPGGNETDWEVVVVPSGMNITTGTPEPTSTHPYTVENLDANTAYDVYVHADCGTGVDFSSWSQVCSFTTTPLCSAPTNVTVSQVAGTSALVTWTEAVFGATGYNIGYTETGQNNWNYLTVTGNSYMLTGLTPETAYTLTITSICDEGVAPTITKTFTTPCLFGGDLVIDNGTSTSYNIPLNTFYNYSYVQQLYLASELNYTGDITSVGFQYIYSTSQTKTNQSIYLAETDLTSLSTWIPADSLTLVYSGTVNYNNSGTDNWVTITFTTPFNYSGTRNLVVVVKNDDGDYTTSSNNTFKTHSASGMTLQYYNDSSPFSLTSPQSASTYSYRNNIKFGMECDPTVTCIAPNVYAAEVTENSITLDWAPGYSESSWELETSTDNVTWSSEGTITSAPYTISSLNPNTLYYIRMRSDCGGGEYSSWTLVSERTACAAISTLPFMENFDTWTGATTTSVATNNLPNCWNYHNEGTSTSYSGYPIIYNSTTYAVSGTNSMRFYTSVTANTYDAQVAILPEIDVNTLPMNTLQLTFDARDNTTSYPFNLVIGVMTDPTDINTFMPVTTITTSSTTYANYEIPLNQYTGTGAYIAIKAPQPTSGYNYGYVDNVKVELIPSCPKPTQVHAVSVTANTIELAWTENGSATSWVIEYGPAGFTLGNGTTENASTNPYTISNLNASTTYDFYIKSECDGGEYSNYSSGYSTTTACDAISQLPYLENFDSYGTGEGHFPNCWGKINTYSSDRPYCNTTHYAGTASLYFFTGTSGTYNIAVTPPFDATIPVNTLQATFMYRAYSTTDKLIVGVMTNPTDASTFVPVDTITPESTASTWVEKEVVFNNYSGTGQYIAFKNAYTTTSAYAYIDNLSIDLIPSCPKPQHVHLTGVSNSSIELGWTEIGSASSWEIEYGPVGFTLGNGTTETATTNPYTITGLTASTQYDFYIRSDCGGGDYSNYSSVFTTATECDAIDQLPYTEDFDTYGTGESAYPLCWGKINTYSSNRPYCNATHYAGTASLYFYAGSTGTYNIAITPSFDASIPINTLQATFMYRASYSTDMLIVGVMTNPADASTFVPVDTVYPATSSVSAWEEREVNFNQYTGTGQYIAFKNAYTSTYCYSYIDNLSINLIPSCPKPQHLQALNATTSSIELGWTDYGSATSWEIAYGAPGFDPDGTAATIVTATSNPFTISNLNSSTTYEFYVRSLCGGSDVSYWSTSIQTSTTMTPTSLPYTADFSDPNDAWVLNNGSCGNYWVKGTVSNTPALFVTDNGTTPNYSGSTAAVAALKLFTVGTADTITISFDIVVNGESSFDYFKLFLAPPTQQFPAATSVSSDHFGYNSYSTNAYNFYANGYGTQSSYPYVLNLKTTTTHVTAKMLNPNTNPNANSTALMALTWKNDPSVYNQPPATITNLTVTANSSGPVVTNPTVTTNAASSYTQTTATLNATITNPDNVTITAKGFEWRQTNGGTYTQIAGTGTGNTFTANLTGLTANTSYTYKAFITFNGTTVYGSEMTFTTLPEDVEPCNAPTNLQISNITQNSATATWTPGGNENAWNVQYKLQSSQQWQEANVQQPTYTIEGLTANSTYDVRVKAVCAADNQSDFVSTTFTTTGVGIDNITLANSISLMPNPADNYIELRVNSNVEVKEAVVFNAFGQMIQTVQLTDNHTRIDLSDMAAGMYFVRVNGEGVMATKKFIKK
jgi:hypothetical protein